jgi:D-alanyl-D-alanine carboxypeptidase/D-alanyl-D-alanine-endopeptidase (penicillin-binding protein 4)
MRRVYRRRRFVVGLSVLFVGFLLVRGVAALVGGSESPVDAAMSEDGAPIGGGVDDEEPDELVVATEPCPAGGFATPAATEAVPPELTSAIDQALAHRSLEIRDAGVSIWIEGYGEVGQHEPDTALVPASNQKILTAMGALILLPHDLRLTTEVRATAPVGPDGTIDGDLVIVGGGDAMIKREGQHSLQKLAQLIRDAGVSHITGSVIGDESRYDQVRRAPGWLEWQQPLPGGSMSALMVNSNSRVGAQDYLANPTQHNAELVKDALDEVGVAVDGDGIAGTADGATEDITTMDSYTVAEMVQIMLLESDNMVAEMLTKEIGLREADDPSSAAGLAAIETAVEDELCVELEGIADDASGISRDDKRSAREWRTMLQAAQDEEWWPIFHGGLPVAAQEPGTLKNRFVDQAAAGDLRAKTGSVGVSVALSGYLTTDGGRNVVFSVITNGSDPEPAVAALDQLLNVVAADQS